MKPEEIRKLLEQDKLIIGHNAVRSAIKDGSCSQVLVASNAEPMRATSLRGFCSLSELECVDLELRNDVLGRTCRKPFSISFLAVKA